MAAGVGGESRSLELTSFGLFVDVQLKTLRGHVVIPKSYSYGGPCLGFEPKSECFKALGWFREVRLNGGLSRRPSSSVISLVRTCVYIVPFMSSMSRLPAHGIHHLD